MFHGIEASNSGLRNKRWWCSTVRDSRKREVVATRELTGQLTVHYMDNKTSGSGFTIHDAPTKTQIR